MLYMGNTIPNNGSISMNLHTAMSVFVEVARAGGFAEAARKLGMSTTAVSRHVSELEQDLGVALLRRTTRHVSLTEAGARYLPRASSILEEIRGLQAETSVTSAEPRGQLRITAPPGVGYDWIADLALDFIAAYPEIELDLDLTPRVVDLVAEGYDAAIRSGELLSSSMIAHRIIDIQYALCASPGFLARHGTPKRPEAIRTQPIVYWSAVANRATWTFTKKNKETSVPIRARLSVTHLASLRHAALRGLGMTVLPLITVQDDLDAGRLVRVLADHEFERSTLSLVRPPTPFEPPKLRVFIDFITEALRKRAGDSRAA